MARSRLGAQNAILLVASYVFYGFWDWRFLALIAVSTVIDYGAALGIAATSSARRRRLLLVVSIVTNLGLLGVFKYFNFFRGAFIGLLEALGFHPDLPSIYVILPVGISFYTFQTMSYTIDVYRGKLAPTRRFLDFALYVAFFPQLVAGPIERASRLLPQILAPRTIRAGAVNAGIYLILLGYLKKVAIADNIAPIANRIFDGCAGQGGLDVFLGIVAFTIQIYCDFSGYSDIARGVSRLMGFELMVNFRLPYFARDPRDFWSRWHISLSTWLRDYLYVPLGGNCGGRLATYRNLSLTMLLGGLWHGAAWNFVFWGAYHGVLLVVYRAAGWDRETARAQSLAQGAHAAAKTAVMFVLVMVGWVLFRCSSVEQVAYILGHVGLTFSNQTGGFAADLVFFAAPLLALDLAHYATDDLLAATGVRPWLRGLIYGALLIWIILFGAGRSFEFIYFQF